VLRLILTLSGECVVNTDPHIGLLHRGTEKLIEYKTLVQGLPYLDRLDYVSRIANEHSFVLAIERCFLVVVKPELMVVRVLFLELTRLLNHLRALTTHRIDVGRLTPFLWAFEEREKIIEFYENVSGARRHANWITIGGVRFEPSLSLLCDIARFVDVFSTRVDEIEDLLVINRVWCHRTQNVGIVTRMEALVSGASGPRLRSTGYCWDLRKNRPYEAYSDLSFIVPVGANGDCFDRFILRLYERRESLGLIHQCLDRLRSSDRIKIVDNKEGRLDMKQGIEVTIQHFKKMSSGGAFGGTFFEVFSAVEAPKGEFGVYLAGGGGVYPYRVGFKAPGLQHLFITNIIAVNHLLADIVTIIGTQDVVFGEVDR
jgi:NADH dehydrogenase (ubiquinone) Fe-S protein 2